MQMTLSYVLSLKPDKPISPLHCRRVLKTHFLLLNLDKAEVLKWALNIT